MFFYFLIILMFLINKYKSKKNLSEEKDNNSQDFRIHFMKYEETKFLGRKDLKNQVKIKTHRSEYNDTNENYINKIKII